MQPSGENERIVITGLGLISRLGNGIDSLRRSPGTRTDSDQKPPSWPAPFAGEIDEFAPISKTAKRTIRKSQKIMNRETQLAIAAVGHAIGDAGLEECSYEPARIGVCFGAGNVEIDPNDFSDAVRHCSQQSAPSLEKAWAEHGIGQVQPLWILRILPNMPACHIAIICDYQGPNNTITQRAASANQAMQEARNHILDGQADAMIVGACGTGIRFRQPTSPATLDDVPPSEAAAAFVVERLDHAVGRGAPVYGEVLAAASRCAIDGTHNPKPDVALESALKTVCFQAGIQSDEDRVIVSSDRVAQTFIDEHHATVKHHPLLERIGDVDAASGAVGLAASLLSLQDTCSPVINLNATVNGLASCLALQAVHSKAA